MINLYTYDVRCSVLKQPFHFVSEDLSGTVLAVAGAGPIGARWGAQLSWAARKVDTYRVVITDTHMSYTTVVIGDFNAAGGGTFDVIMQKLPPGGTLSGGGSGSGGGVVPPGSPIDGSTLGDIHTRIGDQTQWNDEEKEAVRRLITAYVAVGEHPGLHEYVTRWEAKLQELGVPVAALKAAAKRTASASFSV